MLHLNLVTRTTFASAEDAASFALATITQGLNPEDHNIPLSATQSISLISDLELCTGASGSFACVHIEDSISPTVCIELIDHCSVNHGFLWTCFLGTDAHGNSFFYWEAD
jgi:hypothetical protein